MAPCGEPMSISPRNPMSYFVDRLAVGCLFKEYTLLPGCMWRCQLSRDAGHQPAPRPRLLWVSYDRAATAGPGVVCRGPQSPVLPKAVFPCVQ